MGFTHHLGVAFYRVCSPKRTGGAEKRPKDSFWPFSLVCFRKRSHVGSALCSAEILFGSATLTALWLGIRCTGRRFPKAAVFAGRGLSGRMQPSEVFQSVPPRRGGQASFPLDCCLRKSHRNQSSVRGQVLLCKFVALAVVSRRNHLPVGQWPGQRVLAKRVWRFRFQWRTFLPSVFSRCLQARGHAHRSTFTGTVQRNMFLKKNTFSTSTT